MAPEIETSPTTGDELSWPAIRSALRRTAVPSSRPGQQDHELVAAPAADHVGVAHGARQPSGTFLQHEVAELVAERVVDLLEAVQVDEHHAQPGVEARAVEDRFVGQPFELATVDEARSVRRSSPAVRASCVRRGTFRRRAR